MGICPQTGLDLGAQVMFLSVSIILCSLLCWFHSLEAFSRVGDRATSKTSGSPQLTIQKKFQLPNAVVPAEPGKWFHWTILGEHLPIPESITMARNIEPGLDHVLQLYSWSSREWGQCHMNLVDEDSGRASSLEECQGLIPERGGTDVREA